MHIYYIYKYREMKIDKSNVSVFLLMIIIYSTVVLSYEKGRKEMLAPGIAL